MAWSRFRRVAIKSSSPGDSSRRMQVPGGRVWNSLALKTATRGFEWILDGFIDQVDNLIPGTNSMDFHHFIWFLATGFWNVLNVEGTHSRKELLLPKSLASFFPNTSRTKPQETHNISHPNPPSVSHLSARPAPLVSRRPPPAAPLCFHPVAAVPSRRSDSARRVPWWPRHSPTSTPGRVAWGRWKSPIGPIFSVDSSQKIGRIWCATSCHFLQRFRPVERVFFCTHFYVRYQKSRALRTLVLSENRLPLYPPMVSDPIPHSLLDSCLLSGFVFHPSDLTWDVKRQFPTIWALFDLHEFLEQLDMSNPWAQSCHNLRLKGRLLPLF